MSKMNTKEAIIFLKDVMKKIENVYVMDLDSKKINDVIKLLQENEGMKREKLEE